MEWKLFEGDVPHVSTFEFHEHRDRAPHVDQPTHRPRLDQALTFALRARDIIWERQGGRFARIAETGPNGRVVKLVDLGCGDGGFLSLIGAFDWDFAGVGYDFQPTNAAGWSERAVEAHSLNFVEKWPLVIDADVYVTTEVLEHLADPHGMVRNIRAREAILIASSPWTEHAGSHDECHAWAWDEVGYPKMIADQGYDIVDHQRVGMFQVVLATPHA